MIVDSSAIIAVLRAEPDARLYSDILAANVRKLMAAPTYLETSIVLLGKKGATVSAELEMFIQRSGISVVPFTLEAARTAVNAFLRYGKGRHPAGLNFGDCISYAMAKTEAMPLLFKGDDFQLTDVEPAI